MKEGEGRDKGRGSKRGRLNDVGTGGGGKVGGRWGNGGGFGAWLLGGVGWMLALACHPIPPHPTHAAAPLRFPQTPFRDCLYIAKLNIDSV